MTDVGVIDGKYVVGLLRMWSQLAGRKRTFQSNENPKINSTKPTNPNKHRRSSIRQSMQEMRRRWSGSESGVAHILFT